ncbi:hypothetical protein BR93DRAFT_74303 [Coniochaeta sp. PMI_546]|nr:hypothetical protein BR93DRAFT_74303 [Coniochaeta sp. PMI_546]
MPAYLCHGFRWQRRSVRVFVIVQNLDDASPEWIIPARSSQCILESFYNLFDFLPYCVPPPRSGSGYGSSRVTLRTGGSGANSDDENHVPKGNGTRSRSQSGTNASQKSRSQSRTRSRQQSNPPLPSSAPLNAHGLPAEDELKVQDWSVVKLLEEYDPLKLDEVSRPYAYVADYAVKIDLSASIFDEIARYEERVRTDRDPPITGPCDEGGLPAQSKKKSGKKQQQGNGTGWFERLRDQLQRGEEIRWYVVVNGDEVRDWPDEPEGKAAKAAERPKATRAQQEHHSQYMLQQQIFEDIDKNGKKFPIRTDKEKWDQIPKGPPPALKTATSAEGQGLRPKTPSKGGFRRLFGRNHKGEEMSP